MFFSGKLVLMRPPNRVQLEPGRVYRTRELRQWTRNPPRLAKRLVLEGSLVKLAGGLYLHPRRGRFGDAPPSDQELMRAYLGSSEFVFTGPEQWNALGLGTTAVSPSTMVYNTKRTARVRLGGRPFDLHRVGFPRQPSKEWFVVDLFENADQVGASRNRLSEALKVASKRGDLDGSRLIHMAQVYGTQRTQNLISSALGA